MRPSILKSFNPDILVEMIEMAYSLENWDKVIEAADILYRCVQALYEEWQYRKAMKLAELPLELNQPLVYYYGFGHHMRGIAYLEKEEYEQAKAWVDMYAELGWREGLDDKGLEVVAEFRFLAQTIRYAIDLMSGKTDVLDSYVDFLRENPEELLPGLNMILRAALKYGYDVDGVLSSFVEPMEEFSAYEDEDNQAHYYCFSHQMALYKARKGHRCEALTQVVETVRIAHHIGKDSHIGQSLALFEWLRDTAQEEQIQEIRTIVHEAWYNKA